jgi:hypothetical protein
VAWVVQEFDLDAPPLAVWSLDSAPPDQACLLERVQRAPDVHLERHVVGVAVAGGWVAHPGRRLDDRAAKWAALGHRLADAPAIGPIVPLEAIAARRLSDHLG